ncbi:MAG: hypothetical protein IBX55_08675 [Methyloprofundus sp.]|nr:hypothetical protein [Methyloprofundus sp.]MBW6452349.1 hypothetical protein [Methyloprofundus sp.]
MAIGSGVPRAKMALHQQGLTARLLTWGGETGADLTAKMQISAQSFLKAHNLVKSFCRTAK